MQLARMTSMPDTTGEYWQLYQLSFSDLRTRAVQEHMMTEAEFDDLLRDSRIPKYVMTDPEHDRVAALSMMTTDLDAVHLVSDAYFSTRWPTYHRDRLIFYVVFVAVHPDYQGTGVFVELVDRLISEATRAGGVICVDICEYREAGMHLPDVLERLARLASPDVVRHRLDAQVYWGYEFPRPA